MQVEVCVQDGSDSEAAIDRAATRCEISAKTWEFWFQRWLEVLQPDLSPIQAYELSLRLTNDREVQTLNHQFRQQDKPTDVLAFAALEDNTPQSGDIMETLPLYLGDIVISIETARRQAQTQGHSLETELAWLAAHGLLHLLGWDHPDEEQLLCMLNQQQLLLSTVGVTIQTG
jgi:probable rRNA maturation factor